MTNRIKEMTKKKWFRVLVVFVVLVLCWIVLNRFDAPPSDDIFTHRDVPSASLDRSNGFYLLWALSEPPKTDITSGKIVDKYRKLFDPTIDYRANVKAYDFKAYRTMYSNVYRAMYKALELDLNTDLTQMNWSDHILSKKEALKAISPELRVLYRRYEAMINRPLFEDFITLEADAPLPNLLAWLHAAKLYVAINMLTALEGDWDTGVSNILDALDFGKRAVKGSRYLIVKLISSANKHLPLQALADLMNRKECPDSVYRMVSKRMPPLDFSEYGSRTSMICEYLGFACDFIDNPYHSDPFRGYHFFERIPLMLFLQENRTKKLADAYFRKFIELERTPPHLWTETEIRMEGLEKKGPFWWLWNAGGKVLFGSYALYTGNEREKGLYAVIFKSYHRKALYDMVRISAELHLAYNKLMGESPGTEVVSVPEVLKGLESYRELDQCSGKPYRWNETKQLLYGVGTDRVDNGGETNAYKQVQGTDYAIPVILYKK